MVDYSGWKEIEVSDDEDETHPNVDTRSLFDALHSQRVERMEEMKREREVMEAKKAQFSLRKRELERRRGKGEDVTILESTVKKDEKKLLDEETELAKKERLTPWNIDTIGQDGFSKTVINQSKPRSKEKEESEEEKAGRFRTFSIKYEKELKEFGMLRRYEDSKKYLQEHPHLACEDTANYLVFWCIDLAIEEKFNLMDHVSHQCIAIQFLVALANQLDMDPRGCVGGFFSKIAHEDNMEYREAFNLEMDQFQARIRKRAEEKIQEAKTKERQGRLGPGGLDPLEVFETLPEAVQKCFESADIPLLQRTIAEMPEAEASYIMKRCMDSGLWIPSKLEDKAPSKGEDKAPSKAEDKAPSKGEDKAPFKGKDKAPSTGEDKAPSKGEDKAPSKEGGNIDRSETAEDSAMANRNSCQIV